MGFQAASQAILANAKDFHREPESQMVLFSKLLEEIAELYASIENRHSDSPEYELIQIGGIVLNMLQGYSEINIRAALMQIRARHGIKQRNLSKIADPR